MEKKTTIKRYPLSKQVADQLEKMIENGDYAVGEKIPTEPELMEMFSVSRNTLREAIQSLAAAGILMVKQGDGTYVRSNNRFHARMSMEYEQVSLKDIQETRNALEITIAPLAALRRTETDLEEIREALVMRQTLKESSKENTKADIEFHMAIARSCHNQILLDLYLSISSFLESHIAERQAETELNADEIDKLHEKLYLAIQNGDPKVAGVCAEDILKI